MRVRFGLFALAAGMAMAQGTWKEFTLAPAGKLDKPLEKTVEWTFPAADTKVAYPSCCPWLDVEGSFARVDNDPWSLRANGISIKSLLARMEGIPQVQIVAPDWMTSERYSLTAIVSEEHRLHLRRREDGKRSPGEELRELIEKELADRLQIRTHRENRTVPVYLLKAVDGVIPKLGMEESGQSHRAGLRAWAREGAFEFTNANDFIVLTWLRNALKRPVFGQGLPTGPYHFALKWAAGNDRSLATALWEQLGLALVEEQRGLDFLIVDSGLKPETR
jgi:uncharacterized protein (TIGR03435 family)